MPSGGENDDQWTAAAAAALSTDGADWTGLFPLIQGPAEGPEGPGGPGGPGGLAQGPAGPTLTRIGAQLFPQLVDPALCPSNPYPLRLAAAELCGALFRLLHASSDPAARADVVRLVSYKKRAGMPAGSERYAACAGAAQSGVAGVLTMLDDGRDEVRLAAVEALRIAAPLVVADALPAGTSASASASTNVSTSASASASAGPTFTTVVDRLLFEFGKIEGNNTPGEYPSDTAVWLQALDAALRTLAVLDAAAFETRVRAALQEAPAGTDASWHSGLIDHAGVLQALS